MQLQKVMVGVSLLSDQKAAHVCKGDTAVALLKAGAEIDKRDADGFLAIDLAPDQQVWNDSAAVSPP
jgi:26S proteasome non-ATPase regulatory subunit 10